MSQHAKEVETRKEILKRLIDIIIFIGTLSISYSGKEEAAYSLVNRTQNHGNFKELILKYDSIINNHVEKSIKSSEKNKNKYGRGSLVTLMSKHFINDKIIKPIGYLFILLKGIS